MLGDTAVAVHPDPGAALDKALAQLPARIMAASKKERAELEGELEQLTRRRVTHLPNLIILRDMAKAGRKLRLPLLGREIPLILDEWAQPGLGSGCVKITPGHDPNDYEVWKRHHGKIAIINILNPDGSLNENAGPYSGQDRWVARENVLRDLESQGLIESVEDREIEIGHSDRSKTPIEPFLCKQWFVRMRDVVGGIECGAGSPRAFRAAGLAQAAIDACNPAYRSPSGRRLDFHPDAERYAGTYTHWLEEKRDWCISRQLWWGHRIPIWHQTFSQEELPRVIDRLPVAESREMCVWIADREGELHSPDAAGTLAEGDFDLLVCPRNAATEQKYAGALEQAGLRQDPDVLDTWFSSALWPFSTLGWPDPETAEVDPGTAALRDINGFGSCLDYYYPGSCLVTGRDIITLWVARMMMMGLYLLGDVPFTDCFVHANIQDGKGERMSKSKGNGIDPVDIKVQYGTDAMRYVLCDMQTGTQDIRLPVQAVSPFTDKLVDLAIAKHGRTIFTYICPESGKEFDVLGTMKDIPTAKVISERFEVGRAFCTKLWNAARFALMSLEPQDPSRYRPYRFDELEFEDRWILTRLSATVSTITRSLEKYNPSQAIGDAREFFWSDFCDWYLEIVKPRLKGDDHDSRAAAVLAHCFDWVLRLLHPFVPFITEELWGYLRLLHPRRGIDGELSCEGLLIRAPWPEPPAAWADESAVRDFELLQGVVRAVRNWRSERGFPPSRRIGAVLKADGSRAAALHRVSDRLAHLAGLEGLEITPDFERPKTAARIVHLGVEVFLLQVINLDDERRRMENALKKWRKELEQIEKRLASSGFIQRAPAEVVAAERQRRETTAREIELLEQGLRELDS